MSRGSVHFVRRWLYPTLLLLVAPLALFAVLYALDWQLGSESGVGLDAFVHYVEFSADSSGNTAASLAGIIAAILGILITVVSIVVQLSANRFPGVTRMFLGDRITLCVLAYYIVTCVVAVWLGPAIHDTQIPKLTLLVTLTLTTFGIVLVLPYFGYVFWFLEPINIVARIRRGVTRRAQQGAGLGVQSPNAADAENCFRAQADVIDSMEQLSDICSNSISGKDKIIASATIDALKDFCIGHVAEKQHASQTWFRVGPRIRRNPDFVAMAPDAVVELEQRATWVEWKVLRHYLGIYNEALASMRDINYLIAIDTRYIGEAALSAKDAQVLALVVRFFNSYLRTTLNARDVRTAYNVLNQYRLLVEAMLHAGLESEVLQAVKQIRYYGQLSYEQKLNFVTETVAYDVSQLCELAAQLGSRVENDLLSDFLLLDQPLDTEAQERALLGVRKAQAKLACFYLERGAEASARRIYEDMRSEPSSRLHNIEQQLAAVKTKDFWEITDRGGNFEFMPDARRAQLSRFFAWFELEPASRTPASIDLAGLARK